MAVQFQVIASESMVERVDVTEDIERRIRLREEAKKAKAMGLSSTPVDATFKGKPQ